jgi:hypothetical protein
MFGLKKLISKIEVVINSLAKTPHLNRRVTESGMGIGRLVSIAPPGVMAAFSGAGFANRVR